MLQKVDTKSFPGFDKIPPIVVKHCCPGVNQILTLLFKICYNN